MNNSNFYNKKQVYSQAFHISLSGFKFLYTLAVFNSCTDNVSASLGWGKNKLIFVNIFSTIVMVGLTIGSLFTAFVLNKLGRRLSLIYCDVAYILGSIILVMPHTIAFGIGRGITSISVGVFATVAPVYILETSPIALIPTVAPILPITAGVGMLCANTFSLFLPYENFSSNSNNRLWIFLFLFPALISSYQLGYFIIFQKLDSPQFYMSKNQKDLAMQALKLTHNESGMQSGINRLNSDIKGISFGNNKLTLKGMIRQKKFRKMFRVGFIMAVLQQLCGTTAIMFYSTNIFKEISSGLFMSRVVTVLLGVVNLIGSVCSLFFMRKFGRKSILASSMILIAVDLILLGVFSQYVRSNIIVPAVFLISYNFFYSYGLASTFLLYMSEVVNDQIYGITTTLRYATGVLVASIFPIAVNGVGLGIVLFFFSFCMIIGFIYSLLDLVETKGKDKETILTEMKVIEKVNSKPEIADETYQITVNDNDREASTDRKAKQDIANKNLEFS